MMPVIFVKYLRESSSNYYLAATSLESYLDKNALKARVRNAVSRTVDLPSGKLSIPGII